MSANSRSRCPSCPVPEMSVRSFSILPVFRGEQNDPFPPGKVTPSQEDFGWREIMLALLKLIPVACIATVVGTVAGYSLHRPATESVKVCVVPETIVEKSAARLGDADRAAAWAETQAETLSWKRWPSGTDF